MSFGWIEKSKNTSIYWYLRRSFTKDVIMCMQTLRAVGEIPSQWELHTFYLFWSDFLGDNQEKPGGNLSPPGKNQNRNQFVGHGGGLLNQKKKDSRVYRKTGSLPLIFRENQSRHNINDEVWETVKKVWNSWYEKGMKFPTLLWLF